jgi:hypothetical protein
MADLISWPIGPLTGDQYSVNGKFWEFNGCAWISTCCPGGCSIFNTGIILGITEDIPWGPDGFKAPITIKICFSYDVQTGVWNSEPLNDSGDYYQMIEPILYPGEWDLNLMSLGVVIATLGTLVSTEPIGNWKWNKKNQKAETICGCPSGICGCATEDPGAACGLNISFFQVSSTGISGATIGYIDASKKFYIYYNSLNSEWELYEYGSISGATPLFTISLPITAVPVGDWIIGSPSNFNQKYPYFSTTLGHCHPCNAYLDGIILAYTTNGLTTYVPLIWNSIAGQFENFDDSIYIKYNGADGDWNLWINGTLAYSHKGDLLGYWEKEITILCGNTTVTNTEGCLVATTGGETTTTLYLQENTAGEFNYGYPFTEPTWRIVCDAGVWDIQQWISGFGMWQTQATATASCTTPPYSLTWTIEDGVIYTSFAFTEGPCPIVCSSYTFSTRADKDTISFKLCGCDQTFYINVGPGGQSAAYCVEDQSIDLGPFGTKTLIETPCTMNLSQCYTIRLENTSPDIESSCTYTDCNGDPATAIVGPQSVAIVCGLPCSIVAPSLFRLRIEGLGC